MITAESLLPARSEARTPLFVSRDNKAKDPDEYPYANSPRITVTKETRHHYRVALDTGAGKAYGIVQKSGRWWDVDIHPAAGGPPDKFGASQKTLAAAVDEAAFLIFQREDVTEYEKLWQRKNAYGDREHARVTQLLRDRGVR